MIPSCPEWKAPGFKLAEGGEIGRAKVDLLDHSGTVPFAHSVAIPKSATLWKRIHAKI